MSRIVATPLPNSISSAPIADATVRKTVMMLNENVNSVYAQVKNIQSCVREGVKSNGLGGSVQSIAEKVAPIVAPIVEEKSAEATAAAAAASASALAASGSASSASGSATDAETAQGLAEDARDLANVYANGTAGTDGALQFKNAAEIAKAGAVSAKTSAESAKTAAESARDLANIYANGTTGTDGALQFKNAAEAARDRAEAAAAIAERPRRFFVLNTDLGANIYRRFILSDLVDDTSKTYILTVEFYNEAGTARTCVVWKNTASTAVTDGTSVVVPVYNTTGKTPGHNTITDIELTGTDFFRIDNITTTVGVFIILTKKVA